MLTREEWTKGPGTPPAVKGLVWLRMGPGLQRGLGLGSMGNLSTEGSASLQENMLQSFRPMYMRY